MTRLSLLSDHVTVSRQGGHCRRGRRPDMSDDIRRKKKKQGRRPKNTDEKEKETAGRDKKEPEPVTVTRVPPALPMAGDTSYSRGRKLSLPIPPYPLARPSEK